MEDFRSSDLEAETDANMDCAFTFLVNTLKQNSRYNEWYSSVPPAKVVVKCLEQNPDITDPRYNKQV